MWRDRASFGFTTKRTKNTKLAGEGRFAAARSAILAVART